MKKFAWKGTLGRLSTLTRANAALFRAFRATLGDFAELFIDLQPGVLIAKCEKLGNGKY